MRDITGATVRPLSRVKGRFVLERRIRALLVAVHRFGRCRAASADDLAWTARTLDALTATLDGQAQADSPKLSTGDRHW